MGGNALKHCTRRYFDEEYRVICNRITDFIHNTLGVHSCVIPSYKNKASFGDVDVLVKSDFLPPNWKQIVIDKLGLVKGEYVTNGNVFSVRFESIQADLITTQEENFQAAMFYFGFNDLGNLMGRIAHRNGIKLGHKGMSLIVRPRENQLDHVIGEIHLTDDPAVILKILGLDTDKYGKFDDIEDIFRFVADSKYFNPNIFLLENRNSESRVRDKKRKTYNMFLEWCEQNKETLTYYPYESYDGRFGYHINECFLRDVILVYFPDAKTKIDEMIDEFELDQAFKTIFNGDLVREWTGLEGKPLGMLMRDVKPMLMPKELYITHPESVKYVVEEYFKTNFLTPEDSK